MLHRGVVDAVVLGDVVGGDHRVGERVHLGVLADAHAHAVWGDERIGHLDVLHVVGGDQVLLQVVARLGRHELQLSWSGRMLMKLAAELEVLVPGGRAVALHSMSPWSMNHLKRSM
jgi:hypothetical protein